MSDLISRQEAKDEVAEKVFHNLTDEFYGVMQVLDELPSASKSGHWVMNPSEVAGDGYYICSNCNNDVYDATDFCPNCGADMRGGDND